jgi:hypothetical protein
MEADGAGWDVTYRSGPSMDIKREHYLTREGADLGREDIIRKKNPLWTATTRRIDHGRN